MSATTTPMGDPQIDPRVLDAPSDGAFQRWTARRRRGAAGAPARPDPMREAYEGLTELVRKRLQGSDPEDLITIIDEIAEDPEYQAKRTALVLTSAQRVSLLRNWQEPAAGLEAPSERHEERLQLDRLMREVLRLQLVLLGALAVHPTRITTQDGDEDAYEVAARLPRDPFAILNDDRAPAKVVSAKLAGTRLEVLIFAWPDDGLGVPLERAIVMETIAAARRFLALLVFLLEVSTDLNPRVGTDILPAEERLVEATLVEEGRALRDARAAARDEAKRRRAG